MYLSHRHDFDILSLDGGKSIFEFYGFDTALLDCKQKNNPLRDERTISIELSYQRGHYVYYDFGLGEGGNAITLIRHFGDKPQEVIARCYGERNTPFQKLRAVPFGSAKVNKKQAKEKPKWIQKVETAPLSAKDLDFWATKTGLSRHLLTLDTLSPYLCRLQRLTVCHKGGQIQSYTAPQGIYVLLDSKGQPFQLYHPQAKTGQYPFNKKAIFVGTRDPLLGSPFAGRYAPFAPQTLIVEGFSDLVAALALGLSSVITFGGIAQNSQTDAILQALPQANTKNLQFLFDADTQGTKAAEKLKQKGFSAFVLPQLAGDKSENDLCDYLTRYGFDATLQDLTAPFGYTYRYQDYLSDNPALLQALISSKKPRLLVATTGAGKTHLCRELLKHYESLGKVLLFIAPIQGITIQTDLPNALTICQEANTLRDYDPTRHTVTTFSSFKRLAHLVDKKNTVLIIDEIHELHKNHHNADVLRHLPAFHQVFGLTATYDRATEILLSQADFAPIFAQPQQKRSLRIEVLACAKPAKGEKKLQMAQALALIARDADYHLLAFCQNKQHNKVLAQYSQQRLRQGNALEVSADTKASEAHKDLLKGKLPTALFATSVLALGVNHLDFPLVASAYDYQNNLPADVVQQFGRLRKGGKHLLILPYKAEKEIENSAEKEVETTAERDLEQAIAQEKLHFAQACHIAEQDANLKNKRQNLSRERHERKLNRSYQTQNLNSIWDENRQTFTYKPEQVFQNEQIAKHLEPQNEAQIKAEILRLYAIVGVEVSFVENALPEAHDPALAALQDEQQQAQQQHFEALQQFIAQKQAHLYDFCAALLPFLPKNTLHDSLKRYLQDKPHPNPFPLTLYPDLYQKQYRLLVQAFLKMKDLHSTLPYQTEVEWAFAPDFETRYQRLVSLLNLKIDLPLTNVHDNKTYRENYRNKILLGVLAHNLTQDPTIQQRIKAYQEKLQTLQYIEAHPNLTSKQLGAFLGLNPNTVRSMKKRLPQQKARIAQKIAHLESKPYAISEKELFIQLKTALLMDNQDHSLSENLGFSYKEVRKRLAYFVGQDLGDTPYLTYERVRFKDGKLLINLNPQAVAKRKEIERSLSKKINPLQQAELQQPRKQPQADLPPPLLKPA